MDKSDLAVKTSEQERWVTPLSVQDQEGIFLSVAFASPVEQYRGTEADFEFFESQFAPELSAPDFLPPQDEIYGKSMNIMLSAGHAALGATVEFGQDWRREVLQDVDVLRLRDEFETAANEMVKTADGVGEFVTIERDDSFSVVGGKVLARNGEALSDLIDRGANRSRQIAEASNNCYDIQAERDQADLFLLTNYVEPMFTGASHNFALAISVLPEDGIERDGKKFWQGLGYNTDFECAMGQLYFANKEDGTLTTKVLSIDKSNVNKLADKLRGKGVDIPEDVTPSELIKHPITGNMEYEEACELFNDFVVEYEAEAGLPPKVTTTKKIVAQQKALTDQAFESLYLPVAMSLASGVKTKETSQFVAGIQSATEKMNSQNREAIREVHRKDTFDHDDAVAMHGAVLYSLAETLRSTIVPETKPQMPGYKTIVTPQQESDWINKAMFIDKMGDQFNIGVDSNRSYGGCGAHIEFSDPFNPQDVFGGKINTGIGKENKGNDKEKDGPDGKGPLTFKCKNKHNVTRPFGGYADYCEECDEPEEDRGKSVRC